MNRIVSGIVGCFGLSLVVVALLTPGGLIGAAAGGYTLPALVAGVCAMVVSVIIFFKKT